MEHVFETLEAAWRRNAEQMTQSPFFERLLNGDVTHRQYAAVLRQIFHQTRENPQLQALVTARFRGPHRELVRAFFCHATAEVGHDQLALKDIRALGESTEGLEEERPLPATFALLSSAFHMVEHHSPVAYLGYLFHLEYTPVRLGEVYMDGLERAGIPREAMTFLAEHSTVDVAHVKLIRHYLETMVETQEDLDAVLYMMNLTADLYAKMVEQAVATADCWEGLTSGNPEEMPSAPNAVAELV